MKSPPADPASRERRKQDLVMASQVLRGQADFALASLGGRADTIVNRARRIRDFVAQPAVLSTFGVGALTMLLRGRRRRRRRAAAVGANAVRAGLGAVMLRYALLGWRLYGMFGPTIRSRVAARRR